VQLLGLALPAREDGCSADFQDVSALLLVANGMTGFRVSKPVTRVPEFLAPLGDTISAGAIFDKILSLCPRPLLKAIFMEFMFSSVDT
jgi:hypothetical protein